MSRRKIKVEEEIRLNPTQPCKLRVCGKPPEDLEFSISAMRLDRAIAADEARKAGAK